MFLTLKNIKIFDYKFPPLKILEIIYIYTQAKGRKLFKIVQKYFGKKVTVEIEINLITWKILAFHNYEDLIW